MKSTQQSHTLAVRSMQPANQSQPKSVPAQPGNENQIKTSPSLIKKKGKVALINIGGMGATVANIVYKQ